MAPMTMPSALPPSDPIAQLWRATRTQLADLISEFLGPIEVACALARKARAAVRRKLALLEALVLKLLLIEAAARAQEIPAQWPRFRRRAPTPKPAWPRSGKAPPPQTSGGRNTWCRASIGSQTAWPTRCAPSAKQFRWLRSSTSWMPAQ